MKSSFSDLLLKYDVPVPRYTSYPTVPAWSQTPTREEWMADLQNSLTGSNKSWSIYLHLPFCETLCTFCGCNTSITKDHKQEGDYVDTLLREFSVYLHEVKQLKTAPLQQIHLGGGTPTFFSATQLERLTRGILDQINRAKNNFEASIEVDPRRTTFDQLKVLRQVGFNRVSLGVQDFNLEVQKLLNRIQPFSETESITKASRDLGYESVNFDLIYGLPAQTMAMMEQTLEQTLKLRPDRIAFYSFALVPWIKPAQRLFKDSDLPSPADKRLLYERGREIFLQAGYKDVGMDHFALPSDSLIKSQERGTLHRNFMGYADRKTDVLLGLGVSSISESGKMFHQNEKVLPKYVQLVREGKVATLRGHVRSERDEAQRQKILRLMTQFHLELPAAEMAELKDGMLSQFLDEGLVEVKSNTIFITNEGRPFLRNICGVFDDHLQRTVSPGKKTYSKSI